MDDWFNPDTWKRYVDLANEWKTLGSFVLLVGGTVIGWATGFFRWAIARFRSLQPSAPSEAATPTVAPATERRPLRFVTNDFETRWSWARLSEQEGMHVHGKWHVTNTSNQNFMILKARIEGREALSSFVSTGAPDRRLVSSLHYPVLAKRMTEVSADFTFFPAIARDGDVLIGDVVFTDSYGDEHRMPAVRFRRIGPAPASPVARASDSAAMLNEIKADVIKALDKPPADQVLDQKNDVRRQILPQLHNSCLPNSSARASMAGLALNSASPTA